MIYKIKLVQQRDHLGTWSIVWDSKFRDLARSRDCYYNGNIRGALSGWCDLDRAQKWASDYVKSVLNPSWGSSRPGSFVFVIVPIEERRAPRKISKLPHIRQPYQRPAEFNHETNDCSVHALTVATGCTYAEAHEACRFRTGRKDRSGTFVHRLFTTSIVFSGHAFTEAPPKEVCNGRTYRSCQTLGQFAKANPVGMFLISLPSHSIVLWDGHTIDAGGRPYAARCKVRDAWKVEKLS